MIAEPPAKSAGKSPPSRYREENFTYQPFDAAEEEAYWEGAHVEQPYAGADDFERYAAAYRTGYEGFNRLGAEYSFDDVEEDLQEEYEAEGSSVPWERARDASRAAWERLEEQRSDAETESSAAVN